MTTLPTAHSPLGASSMERVMLCPRSVTLAAGCNEDEEDDTFSAPGSAAHAVGARCLVTGEDAFAYMGWEYVKASDLLAPEGDVAIARLRELKLTVDTIKIDKEIVDAVQEYLDDARATEPDSNQGNTFIERPFHCPSIHKYFYGTTDRAYVVAAGRRMKITDYKHGAGIVVEPNDNIQLKYYACGMLEDLMLWDLIDNVTLRIVQPRAWHWESTVREWEISVADLKAWLWTTLVPAMDNALVSRETKSGEHCRFCPARYRSCPQLLKDEEELRAMVDMIQDEEQAKRLTPEQAGRFADLFEVAKIRYKAVEKVVFGMLQSGNPVPGFKLAAARSNREWKDGAEKELRKKFKGDAVEVKLASPATIEKLPGGPAFVARHAFKPDRGLTVVRAEDARPAVNKDVKSMFKPVRKAGK